MTSNAGTILGSSVRPLDFALKNKTYLNQPQQHQAIQQDVYVELAVPLDRTLTGTNWQSELVFTPGLDFDHVVYAELYLKTSAITKTGGTYAHFADDSSWLLEKGEIKSGGDTEVQSFNNLAPYFENALAMQNNQRSKYSRRRKVNLTPGQRNIAAQSEQELWVPLDCYFNGTRGHGYSNIVLTSRLKYVVTLTSTPANHIVTDGTNPTCNLLDASLRLWVVKWSAAFRQQYNTMILANTGINRLFMRTLREEPVIIDIGATQTSLIKFENTRLTLSEVYFLIRRTEHLTPGTALYNPNVVYAEDQPSEMAITFEGDQNLQKRVDMRNVVNSGRFLPAHTGENCHISGYNWSYAPDRKNTAANFASIDYLRDVSLQLFFGTKPGTQTPTKQLQLLIVGKAYAMIAEGGGAIAKAAV